MKTLSHVALFSILLAEAGVASAQVIDLRRMDITLEYLLKHQKEHKDLLTSSTPDACSGGSCTSVLTVTEIQDSGNPVSCVATANNINLTDPGPGKGHQTIITWTLKVLPVNGTPAKASYAFPPYNGIAVVEDNKKQTSGKGEPDTTTEAKLILTYSNKNDSVTYFPIVLQTIGLSTLMCAAGDPKIVNN